MASPESDTIKAVQGSERRSPPPWWVAELKWLLTGFVFPSAVSAVLLWFSGTTIQKMVLVTEQGVETSKSVVETNKAVAETLKQVSETLRDLRNR